MVDINRQTTRPTTRKTKTTDRPRQRALVMVASTLIGWVALYQFVVWFRSEPEPVLKVPPVLLVDLETASLEELQLLPDIGEKTAQAWRQTLDEAPSLTPQTVKELEALPAVGPVRSNKLAPYLIDSEARTMQLESPSKPSSETLNP